MHILRGPWGPDSTRDEISASRRKTMFGKDILYKYVRACIGFGGITPLEVRSASITRGHWIIA